MINSVITGFSSLEEIKSAFPTEEICIEKLTELRWNGDIISPFDETSKVYACKGNKYRCRNTGKYFNVKTNTLFHNSKVELVKWFQAIWLISSGKKLTAVELANQIEVTPKTAWLMQKRISKFIQAKPENKIKESQLALTDWLNQLR